MDTEGAASSICKGCKILIADDDKDHCLALRLALEKLDFQVEVAHDGVSALEKLREFHPKLVLMDSMLPELPGILCLRRIKQDADFFMTEVIMCSGAGNFDYTVECLEAGASGFVHKPCDLAELSEKVRRLLHGV